MTDEALIRENIRERCIYDISGDLADEWDDKFFWNYLYFIHRVCLVPNMTITDHCAEKMMKSIGIPVDKVNECMEDSFSVRGDWTSYNEMLAGDRDNINDLGVVMNPTLTINSHPYEGEL